MDVNDKTLKLFKGFINDLINVFPEHKESLTNNYNSVLELDRLIINDNDIISEFLKTVDDISDDISDIIAEFEEKHNVSLSHNTHML